MEPICTEHAARGVKMRRTMSDADEGRSASARGSVQCGSSPSQHTAQWLGKGREASHRRHRRQHDRCCSDTLAKICDQLRQVAYPPARPVEPEDVIDAQCDHDDVNREPRNLGHQSRSCYMGSSSNPPHGMPMHCPPRPRGEGGGNLPSQGVRVIRRANTRDGRFADHQKPQRDTDR
jgi:hypothetical protein